MRGIVALGFVGSVVWGALAGTADARTDRASHHKARHGHQRAARVSAAVSRSAAHEDRPAHGQSVGAPWAGTLHDATRFPDGDGYVIRRPWRAFATRTTVEHVEHVVAEVRDAFPDRHVLGIGDFSQEHGGAISDHHSHQTGRDVDIGLFYVEKPASYPREFVRATADNLDCEATLGMIERFAATAKQDGGVQVMFLDYDVQGLLYHWGLDHGESEAKLDRLFQFAHGRGSMDGLVHHIPGHDNHVHVRFQCAAGDTSCER
jgi:murein endopeptidase